MTLINFQDGTILFSANLNTAFANSVNVAGDTMTGPLIVPSIATSQPSQLDGGMTTKGTVNVLNALLFVDGMNVFSTITAAYNQANNATNIAQAGFSSGNATLALAQAAFNTANSINVGGGGGSTSQQTILTSNGIIANGQTILTVFGNNTVVLSANLGNTTQVGVIQLNDTVTSSLITQAATANSVKNIWVTANASFIQANAVNTYAVSGFSTANSALNLALSAFAQANSAAGVGKVSKTGDSMSGSLTINASGTGLIVSNNATITGNLNVFGVDTFTGLVQAQSNANSALNLATSAYGRANAVIQNQHTFFTSNGVTVNSGTSLIVIGNNTILLSANLGNTTQAGIIQLNDTVTSTSSLQAGTANAINTAWTTAIAAFKQANLNYNFSNTFITANMTVTGGTTLSINSNTIMVLSANLGNTTQPGILQLNDTVTSSLTTQAATANAVNTVWNTAVGAFNRANSGGSAGGSQTIITNGLTVNTGTSLTVSGNNTVILASNISSVTIPGIVQLNDTVISTSASLAATANSVNTVWATANAAFNRANTITGYEVQNFTATNGLAVNTGSFLSTQGNNTVALTANNSSTTVVGVVQLNDTITSTLTTQAATANSVNTAWAYANAAFIKANSVTGIAKAGDYMTGTLTVPTLTSNGTIITQSLTANANIVAANIVTSGAVNSAVILVNPIISNTNLILTMQNSGQILTFSNANTTLVNVNNTLVVGFRTVLTQIGLGSIKVQAGAGVTLNPRIGSNNTTLGQFSSISIFCYASNTFILDGSLS